MEAARVAVFAAFATVLIWGVKALAIWNAGGLDESSLESPLFALGLVAIALAFAALGVAATRGRPNWIRVAAAVAALVVGLALLLLVEALVRGLVPASAGWVEEEAGLWVAALLTSALAVALFRRRADAGVAVSR